MFIKPAALKKVIKESYNTVGIRFGYYDDGVTVIGSIFSIWFKADCIPNSIKAVIVEFLGTLPKPGDSCLFVSKVRPVPQHELLFDNPASFDAKEYINCNCSDTKIIFDKGMTTYRAYQNNATNKVFLINNKLLDMYDPEQIDFDEGECLPDGPYASCSNGLTFWYNNTCKLLIANCLLKEDKVIQALEEIKFGGDQ